MEGFTKLFKGITRSTIWSLDNDHIVVWVFLMAEADENGVVVCTLPGLAKANNVTLEKAAAIIKCFMSPDPYSGSKEYEGRRIEEVDRGWRLLNHAKFRRMRSREEKLEYDRLFREKERLAEKVAKLEAEKANKTNDVVEGRKPSSGVVKVVQAEAEAEAEAEEESEGGGRPPPSPTATKRSLVGETIARFAPFWEEKYGEQYIASIKDRRELGLLLKHFRKADHFVGWFREFLADDRPIYLEKRHALYLFVQDMDRFRRGAQQRAAGDGA